MKVTLESTTKIVELVLADGTICPYARLWEGTTESGVPIHAFVLRIAVANDQDHTQFDAELLEQRPPSAAVAAIPFRLVL